eukprot:TRINITY_DN400_c0_g1_i3.p1 TRINITY_DN400_c0_g1~~TRINITY_DN400_c0_g1_i3.p1  ORF type:complete len:202 (-),score=41.16 TRINITY_DN400_c0_g1_i3:831-1436(-)
MFALTYDDGPSEHTGHLLDILKANDVKAAFFVRGNAIEKHSKVLKRTSDEGHEIVAHTWSHALLRTISNDQIEVEVKKTERAVLKATSKPIIKILRPPRGDVNERVSEKLKELGYDTVLWNLDSKDWQHAPKDSGYVPNKVKKAIKHHGHSNIMLLQHDTILESIDAVPKIIEYVNESKDYKFVTLRQCLYGMDYSEEQGN